VVEDCGCKIYVPDIFNPNSSGIDSEFTLNSGCSITKYEIEIYDRWENHLFSGRNITESWDGTYLNSDVEAGFYLYKLTYDFLDEEKVHYGQVNLVR
jgi:gliding motility-associated-like protein